MTEFSAKNKKLFFSDIFGKSRKWQISVQFLTKSGFKKWLISVQKTKKLIFSGIFGDSQDFCKSRGGQVFDNLRHMFWYIRKYFLGRDIELFQKHIIIIVFWEMLGPRNFFFCGDHKKSRIFCRKTIVKSRGAC